MLLSPAADRDARLLDQHISQVIEAKIGAELQEGHQAPRLLWNVTVASPSPSGSRRPP